MGAMGPLAPMAGRLRRARSLPKCARAPRPRQAHARMRVVPPTVAQRPFQPLLRAVSQPSDRTLEAIAALQ